MGQMKTPGVYIVEKDAFPNSIVEVATAVPAFIGYTEKAANGGVSLINKPWRITSMAEYHQYFGRDPEPKFAFTEVTEKENPAFVELPYGRRYDVARSGPKYILYYCMLLFYQNGGGPCYVVSVGEYDYSKTDLDSSLMTGGIDTLIKEQEPTMVVIPEAIKLGNKEDCFSVQQHSLTHCGDKMKNRISIIDVYNGYKDRTDPSEVVDGADLIENFRTKLGNRNLDFASAYYPWINTTILQEKDVNYLNIPKPAKVDEDHPDVLIDILREELSEKLSQEDIVKLNDEIEKLKKKKKEETDAKKKEIQKIIDTKTNEKDDKVEKLGNVTQAEIDLKAAEVENPDDPNTLNPLKDKLKTAIEATWTFSSDITALLTIIKKRTKDDEVTSRNNTLLSISKEYGDLVKEMTRQLNLLPPSAAMAGIYTMVDNSRGVWKAPANVSLNSVVSPAVTISHEEQEDLNVALHGKSINAIRAFIGEGVLVWGARTLDGNSLDWRYINVRRTMIMLEESIKIASRAYVFENNNANTWSTMKSMIGNFLHGIWKRGGLAGTKPEDAYAVFVGLGETMTPEDILEGILRITVLVAVTRPAEFIEITFQQQMQKS